MTEFNTDTIDEIIAQKESDIHNLCSPYSGNCFAVALALYRLFPNKSEGFWSVYADTELIETPGSLPLHIVVQIQGELFDAGGRLSQSHLLAEFAPEPTPELLVFEDAFQYEKVVADDLLLKVMEAYESAFNKRTPTK